ncbi:hypothetical protein ROZALSC1DRAFT_22642 [Rozella allomycis CSF55]|uniref:Exportin-1 C-terminal domain-containing protein n=1 Tax=Rozella allomycis (strain CSF55) TaxID=988480 RepID=A0A4P9YKP4_ROZAC|nr:hypothetical protein ROZALSC1DRAFT_22642 [Rozella allomycis CSF55]
MSGYERRLTQKQIRRPETRSIKDHMLKKARPRFMLGYRDMVLGDIINNYFGLNDDIINLISSLLKNDQCDHFLWFGLYESALTRLVDGNLTHENFYNENELLLNLVKSRGELSHLHPDLFKIVMDRIIFVLNHGSRNVSSAGLEALNTLLERFSNYDFSE